MASPVTLESDAPPERGRSAVAAMSAETNALRLRNGTLKPEQFILDGTLKLLAKLDAELEIATGKALIDTGKLWMTTANGVLRAKRRLKDK